MDLPQPPEILRAMHREAELGERTLAPNRYVVLVATADHPRLDPHAGALAAAQTEFLAAQGWAVCGDVVVSFEAGAALAPGQFRVVAEVRKALPAGPGRGRGIGLLLGDGRRYTVQAGTTVIGRGRQADLRLRDGGVSRRHACLHYDGGALTVTDLGSTNGTTVNDRPVSAAVPVGPGDTIRVGSVTLTVQAGR